MTGADPPRDSRSEDLPEDSVVDTVESLQTIARYQFGAPAGEALFPGEEDLEIRYSRSGRPRQVRVSAGRLVTLGTDGRFTLGLEGGRRLHRALGPPAYRVVVDDESEPFVREGRNVFARFVVDVDETVRPRDEVLVVHERDDTLLGVGRAELSAADIRDFEVGMAVSVREGATGTGTNE